MPTYEYICKNCNHHFEELQSMKEDPLLRCPSCNTDSLARIMGAGSGIIFKGSGFYLTDYKKTNAAVGKTDGEKVKKSDNASDSGNTPSRPSSSTDTTGTPSSGQKKDE